MTEETKDGDGAVVKLDAEDVALRGLDLEALKKSNGPVTVENRNVSTNQFPIYTAQSARAYLLKSFDSPPKTEDAKKSPKKKTSSIIAEKERNLGLLLGSLELLMQSWSSILTKEDLDRRAWGWYVSVRPEVEVGKAGWGEKGNVKLASILALRRRAD